LLLSTNESYLEKNTNYSRNEKVVQRKYNFLLKNLLFCSLAFIPPSDVCDVYKKILKLDFFVKNNQIVFPFLTNFEEI
jgi:hypothetical protein